ncbi:hypothetical protein ACHMZP_21820 [Rhodococcus baikonurensis]|uniref:hypothetical protein n=1 Tax=Rhodococcus baikonurensis TaxID=172041 RepID=UPI003798C6B9
MSGVRIVSLIMGAMAILVGVTYWGPSEWVRRPLPPGQESLVVIIESIGPVWPIIFTVAGTLLASASIVGRYMVAAHVVGIFGWMFYGSAIVVGAILSEPPAPIVTGLIAIGVAAIHFGMTRAHQEVGE